MKTSDQDECVLCCGEIYIFAIGICDHPVCYQCSARMRVLCETNECPICRSNMPMVIWTFEEQLYSEIARKYSLLDKKFQITFENVEAQIEFYSLLENNCNICDEIFQSFSKQKDHVRRKHDLHYCELCTENLKIFANERKVYNRKDLARHKRVGDPDDTSHRGHPLCEFCDQRFMDSDELFRHLRREHYFCHFCDADGKHQYYEDYDYLRVHFRKEHYLCEEGDCINEQFIGAFRSEIDLKAHIAVHHSKNKSKAEVRQARMLEFEFTYAHHNRPSGSSSPRGGRYHQQKRQNVDETSTREKNSSRESNQLTEVEKINTTSTLEFPYLSEDGENKSNQAVPVPTSNFNSVTLQSFGRNSGPLRNGNAMSAADFPALVSASVNVTSEVSNSQRRQFNISVNRQNNAPARTTSSMSIKLAQPSAQPDSSVQNAEKKQPNWISKKKNTNFEDDFPRLETKKIPVPYTNPVHKPVVNNFQTSAPTTVVVPVSAHVVNGDQFVTIKGKSKKKKHNRAAENDNKVGKEDTNDTDDFADKPNFLLTNSYNLLDQENKDPFKKNLVRSGNNSSRNYFNDENTWQQKVSFANDDFPPLAPSEVIRKPPGLNVPKKKPPPPGFNSSSNGSKNSQPLTITLSSVARQLVSSNKNYESQIPQSDQPYRNPPDFQTRNDDLVKKIQALSVFNEFKTVSGEFRKNGIPASDYYSKCLEILGEKGFYDIFPELICLLPDINKQQELLDVHRRFQTRQNNGGAVPKQKLLNNNQVSVCDICYQVLLERDLSGHLHD